MHSFEIDSSLVRDENSLRIIFKEPPRWLGQLGYTSSIRDWKPRFYYTWDWIPRTVQTGITGKISIRQVAAPLCEYVMIDSTYDSKKSKGGLAISATVVNHEEAGKISATISRGGKTIFTSQEVVPSEEGNVNLCFDDLDVDPWFPNGLGDQPLYSLEIVIKNGKGLEVWKESRQIGFKEIVWASCEGAPREATPWICMVNGKRVFLQGVNWTPISPTYADVTDEETDMRLRLYREMGCNLLRVWGGAVLETSHFYNTCDELGLMVWQELPLSSSGIDNWPPEDHKTIEDIVSIATSYIIRRKHHVSLLMYSGGNELQGNLDGDKEGTGKPVDFSHPMMSRLKELFTELDGSRRFIPTSPFGPRFKADMEDFGKGLHWSIHGPWNVDGVLDDRWDNYWAKDDALLRAETGCPGTMDLERLKSYVPSLDILPIAQSNPVWGRTSWWIESDVFAQEFGRFPDDAAEYFTWSQRRQAEALRIAATSSKRRFPACGGIIIWMGHDCYPCAANTSVIDVDAVPKPAYHTLRKVFTTPKEMLDVE
jgi:beta-mannosidase